MGVNEAIIKLREMLRDSKNIVFFGGAGVSTESGIPDFRSAEGLFSEQAPHVAPEEILSHDFFMAHPEAFFDFYRRKMVYPAARPNAAHTRLAQWERAGKLSAVITQNIDGLHGMAGSETVLELHGSIHRNSCMSCKKKFGLCAIMEAEGVPRCSCGGIIKPDVVLYQEQLSSACLAAAIDALRRADMLIVAGTSMNVYPAAGLVQHYGADRLVLVNMTDSMRGMGDYLFVQGKVGEVLGSLLS